MSETTILNIGIGLLLSLLIPLLVVFRSIGRSLTKLATAAAKPPIQSSTDTDLVATMSRIATALEQANLQTANALMRSSNTDVFAAMSRIATALERANEQTTDALKNSSITVPAPTPAIPSPPPSDIYYVMVTLPESLDIPSAAAIWILVDYAMNELGFNRTILGDKSDTYQLPAGMYACSRTQSSLQDIWDTVSGAVLSSRTCPPANVLVVQSPNAFWRLTKVNSEQT